MVSPSVERVIEMQFRPAVFVVADEQDRLANDNRRISLRHTQAVHIAAQAGDRSPRLPGYRAGHSQLARTVSSTVTTFVSPKVLPNRIE